MTNRIQIQACCFKHILRYVHVHVHQVRNWSLTFTEGVRALKPTCSVAELLRFLSFYYFLFLVFLFLFNWLSFCIISFSLSQFAAWLIALRSIMFLFFALSFIYILFRKNCLSDNDVRLGLKLPYLAMNSAFYWHASVCSMYYRLPFQITPYASGTGLVHFWKPVGGRSTSWGILQR